MAIVETPKAQDADERPARSGLSSDAFLGGRLTMLQPAKGFRAGTDSVLLAATIPAADGEGVFEAGLGTGVAACCLARRLPAVQVMGMEIAVRYAMIAEENVRRNALSDRVEVLTGDFTDSIRQDASDWPPPGSFDHAFANPPYFEEGKAQPPADVLRAQAHVLKPGALDVWVRIMSSLVRPRGTVSIIHPASSLPQLIAAMQPRLGSITVFPLRARPGDAATRVIVRGTRGSKAPLRLLPGIALHRDEGNGYVPEIEAVLREGAPLTFE